METIKSFFLSSASDPYRVAKSIEKLATSWALQTLEQLKLVGTELANNVICHSTNGGRLQIQNWNHSFTFLTENQVSAPFPSLSHLLQFLEPEKPIHPLPNSSGLGLGLASIWRCSHFLGWNYRPPHLETRSLRAKNLALKGLALSQAMEGQTFNGDHFFFYSLEEKWIAGILDGIGHGQKAYEVTQEACQVLQAHLSLPLEELLFELNRRLKGSRGAVIAILEGTPKENKVRFFGLGNITAYLWTKSGKHTLPSKSGILGRRHTLPSFPSSIITVSTTQSPCFLLFSDGLSENKALSSLRSFSPLANFSLPTLAKHIFTQSRKSHDDATLMLLSLKATDPLAFPLPP